VLEIVEHEVGVGDVIDHRRRDFGEAAADDDGVEQARILALIGCCASEPPEQP
jgi:hypothetical protein